jgi:hypothetical protein
MMAVALAVQKTAFWQQGTATVQWSYLAAAADGGRRQIGLQQGHYFFSAE